MSGYRPEKIAEQIHKEICQLLMFNIKDPRVALVTVTGVQVSRDIGTAKIFYTVSGDATERADAQRGLKSVSGYLRRQIGQLLRLRSVPELRFIYDESVAYGQKIDALLRQIKDEQHDDTQADS